MGIKGIELLGVVVMVVLVGEAAAQLSCTTVITNLAPCLNYVTGNSSTPSSSCCSQLSNVVQSSPLCLCSLLNGGASLGITINQTLALSLPGACKVRTPPVTQCQAANGPTASEAPTASPSPPADTSGESPEAAITPSASEVPVEGGGGGSKTVPTTDGSSSDGSSIMKAPLPLHFVLLFVFILSSASTFSN